MRARPRLRGAIKWGGSVGLALLGAAWVASGWWCALWSSARGFTVASAGGAVWVELESPYSSHRRDGLGVGTLRSMDLAPWKFQWRPRVITSTPSSRTIGQRYLAVLIPLWVPALPLACGTLAAWRLERRARRRAAAGLCPACGYDRAGLAAGGACPECGAEVEA